MDYTLPDLLQKHIHIKSPEEISRDESIDFDIRMGSNENNSGVPQRFISQQDLATLGLSQYCDPSFWKLKKLLSDEHEISEERIFVGAGIDAIIADLCQVLLKKGDEVLLTDGTYNVIRFFAARQEASVLTSEYRDINVPLEDLVIQVKKHQPKLVYLANPDNPTGSFYDSDVIERFIKEVTKYSYLVIDEAYVDYVEKGCLGYSMNNPRLVRLRTFSKLYGLAGLKIGYAITSESLSKSLSTICHHYGVGAFAQRVAEQALVSPTYRFDNLVVHKECKKKLIDGLRSQGLTVVNTATNFILVVFSENESRDVFDDYLTKNGAFVRSIVVPNLVGLIRISVGSKKEISQLLSLTKDYMDGKGYEAR